MNSIDLASKRERIRSVDAAKAILIWLMVMFHLPFNKDYLTSSSFVYAFHMPSFLLLSGYMMSINKPVKLFCNTIISLIIMYMFFETCYILGLGFFGRILGSSNEISLNVISYLECLLYKPMGTLWYIHTMVICMVVTYVCKYVTSCTHSCVILAACVVYFLSTQCELTNWNNSIFFFIGLFANRMNSNYGDLFKSTWIAIFPFSILACGNAFSYSLPQSIILSCCFLFMTSFFYEKLPSKFTKYFSYLGQNTLAIVVFSPFFTVFIKPLAAMSLSMPFAVCLWLIATLLVITLSLTSAWLIDTIKLSRYVWKRHLYTPWSRIV